MIIKKLTAVAIVAASLAAPAFAQDSVQQKSVHALHHYRGVYNQVGASNPAGDQEFNVQAHQPATEPYFNHDSYDPQRIGGQNPNFNPPS
jgi:opacity protein-like surface antigen